MRIGTAPLTGRRVLAIILGFFATVFAVNIVMVWLAVDSFPGLVSRDAYREGLAWNRTLDAKRAQDRLGWRVAVGLTGTGLARSVAAEFRDRAGVPLSGMAVTARLIRPVVQGHDLTLTLTETAPGRYTAPVALPFAGNWRLAVEAGSGKETVWRMERSLWLE